MQPDLNYASLNLKVTNKPRKKRRRSPSQGCNNVREKAPARLTPPANAFLEVDVNVEAQLPPADESSMVSHSSIYLNSQQIAKEAEERGQRRKMKEEEEEGGFKWMSREEDGGESGNRQDASHRHVCTEGQDRHADTDHFSHSSQGV